MSVHQFIARKGLISEGTFIVSGSSYFSGSIFFNKNISTEEFASGFAGYGTSIYQNDNLKWAMDIDELTVRGRMRIYELLINQIRATNGSVWVSSTGKVDSFVDNGFANSVELSQNLVAHWTFDDETYTSSVGDYDINLNAIASIPFVSDSAVGKKSVYFSGELDAWIQGVIDYGKVNLSDACTISTWFKADSVQTDTQSGIISIGYDKGLILQSNGNLGFYTYDGTSYLVPVSDVNVDYRDDLWHHMVVSYDYINDKVYAWVDGELFTIYEGSIISGDDTIIYFGTNRHNRDTWKFKGFIDDVRIYSSTLTDDQVSQLYALGSQTKYPSSHLRMLHNFNDKSELGDTDTLSYDYTGNGNNGNLMGSPTYGVGDPELGEVGKHIILNGSNQYIQLTEQPTGKMDEGYISVWFTNNDLTPNQVLYDLSGLNENFGGVLFSNWSINGRLGFRYGTLTGSYTNLVHIVAEIDRWIHVVVTWNLNEVNLYVDGVNVSNGVSPNITPTSNIQTIGSYISGSDSHNGKIEEVRIGDKHLSSSEVSALYNNRGGILLSSGEDTNHGFIEGDLIRAQRFTNHGVYQSDAVVTWVPNLNKWYHEPLNLVNPTNELPQVGYEYVRIGNAFDAERQGSVYLTADDSGAPYIDVIDDINSHSAFNQPNTIKVRMGDLDGLVDTSLNLNHTKVYGIYSDSAYLKGNLIVGGNVGEVAIAESTVAIGNVTDTARNAIKIAKTDTDDESGIFGYDDNGSEVFALRLNNTAKIAGFGFDVDKIFSDGITLNATEQYIALPSTASMAVTPNVSGIYLSGSGEFLFTDGAQFIKLSNDTLSANIKNITITGDDASIEVFNFQLGNETNYIKGSSEVGESTLDIVTDTATISGSSVNIVTERFLFGNDEFYISGSVDDGIKIVANDVVLSGSKVIISSSAMDIQAGSDYWKTATKSGSFGGGIFTWNEAEVVISDWEFNSNRIYNGVVYSGTGENIPITLSSKNILSTTPTNVYNGSIVPQGLTFSWHNNNNAGHLTFGQMMQPVLPLVDGEHYHVTPKNGFVGIQMMDYLHKEFFALGAQSNATSFTTYNRIAGWKFNESKIFNDNIHLINSGDGDLSDGALLLGGATYNTSVIGFKGDGSGKLANGNISWDGSGNVTLDPSVTIAYSSVDNTPSNGFVDNFQTLPLGVVEFADINAQFIDGGVNVELEIVDDGGVNALKIGNNTGNDEVRATFGDFVKFDPSKWYRVRIKMKQSVGSGHFYVGILGFSDDTKTYVDMNGGTSYGGHWNVASVKNNSSYVTYTGLIHGYGTPISLSNSPEAKLHEKVKYFKPIILVNFDDKSGITQIESLTLEELPAPFIEGNTTTTKITSTTIESPLISGNDGKFSGKVEVGSIAETSSKIVIDGVNGNIHINSFESKVGGGYEPPTFNTHYTPFFIGKDGNFSISDKLVFDGSSGAPTLSVNGTITSVDGNIGGWTIENNSISSGKVSLLTTPDDALVNTDGLEIQDGDAIVRLQVGDFPDFTEPTNLMGIDHALSVVTDSNISYSNKSLSTPSNINNGTINLSSSINSEIKRHDAISGVLNINVIPSYWLGQSHISGDWELSAELVLTNSFGDEIAGTSRIVNITSEKWYGGLNKLSFLYVYTNDDTIPSGGYKLLAKLSLIKGQPANTKVSPFATIWMDAFVHTSKVSITPNEAFLYTNPLNYLKWTKTSLDIRTENFTTDNLTVKNDTVFEGNTVLSGSTVFYGQMTIVDGTSVAVHPSVNSIATTEFVNGNVIQNLTFDTFGHVTGVSQTNLDDRYYTKISANSTFFKSTGGAVSGDTTFETDVTVSGNLTVSGTTTTISTQHVEISDNILVINNGQVGDGVTSVTAGIEVDRGDWENYQFVFVEDGGGNNSGKFKIGKDGSLQTVATREDIPIDNGIAVWDADSKKFETVGGLTYDGTQLNLSSSSADQYLLRLSNHITPNNEGYEIGFASEGTKINHRIEYSSVLYDWLTVLRSDRSTVAAGNWSFDGTVSITTQATTTSHAVRADRTITINGTTNQINISETNAQNLTSDSSWTLSLPQNIDTLATPEFEGLFLSDSLEVFNTGSFGKLETNWLELNSIENVETQILDNISDIYTNYLDILSLWEQKISYYSDGILTSLLIKEGGLSVEHPTNDILLRGQNSNGEYTIFHSVNDGQGDYNITLGDIDGAMAKANSGASKIRMSHESAHGHLSLNVARSGVLDSTISYTLGLSLDSNDNKLRIGNPSNSSGLSGDGGYVIADNNGNVFSQNFVATGSMQVTGSASFGDTIVVEKTANIKGVATFSAKKWSNTDITKNSIVIDGVDADEHYAIGIGSDSVSHFIKSGGTINEVINYFLDNSRITLGSNGALVRINTTNSVDTTHNLHVEGTFKATESVESTLLYIDNIQIDDNEISSTNENGNITLNANGTGKIISENDVLIKNSDLYISEGIIILSSSASSNRSVLSKIQYFNANATVNRVVGEVNCVRGDDNHYNSHLEFFVHNNDTGGSLQKFLELRGTPTLNDIRLNRDTYISGKLDINGSVYDTSKKEDLVTSVNNVVASVSITGTTIEGVFFDYIISDGTNMRIGGMIAITDKNTIQFTEYGATDINDTDAVTLTCDYDNGNIRLLASITSGTWDIKTMIRAI